MLSKERSYERFMNRILSITLVIGLAMMSASQVWADNSGSSMTLSNVIPVSSGVSIDNGADAVFLTENTTKNVIVTATITDNNGCPDITGFSVKFFRTDFGSACTPDENNCYLQATSSLVAGTCTGPSDLSADYTATIPVWYYADPTDVGSAQPTQTWSAQVTPSDLTGAGTAGSNDTIEMATMVGAGFTPSNIPYSTLNLGVDSGTNDTTLTVTNTGNQAIGALLDGFGSVNGDGLSMTCTPGSIPIGNERYHLTPSTTYASKIALTDTSTNTTQSLVKTTNGASPTTGNIYWGMGAPSSIGVQGACTGVVVFTPA
jgi:hypothetical protein